MWHNNIQRTHNSNEPITVTVCKGCQTGYFILTNVQSHLFALQLLHMNKVDGKCWNVEPATIRNFHNEQWWMKIGVFDIFIRTVCCAAAPTKIQTNNNQPTRLAIVVLCWYIWFELLYNNKWQLIHCILSCLFWLGSYGNGGSYYIIMIEWKCASFVMQMIF